MLLLFSNSTSSVIQSVMQLHLLTFCHMVRLFGRKLLFVHEVRPVHNKGPATFLFELMNPIDCGSTAAPVQSFNIATINQVFVFYSTNERQMHESFFTTVFKSIIMSSSTFNYKKQTGKDFMVLIQLQKADFSQQFQNRIRIIRLQIIRHTLPTWHP